MFIRFRVGYNDLLDCRAIISITPVSMYATISSNAMTCSLCLHLPQVFQCRLAVSQDNRPSVVWPADSVIFSTGLLVFGGINFIGPLSRIVCGSAGAR